MAGFTPSKKTAQDFNDGVKYINGQGNETGDALQAETINNLVESALYTQEQADSAKQTAQGALSQVNQVLADKTLLPDVQKNYYNLGAFDTYVSNGDNTGTATSRTGYLVIDANSDIQVVQNPNGTHRCAVARNLPISSAAAIKSNYLQRASFDDVYLGRQYFAVYDSVNVVVSILGITSESEYRLYFSQHPLIFQYELASKYQYTQKVIENQPIRFLPLDGELKLYEEWRKGLNLYKGQDIIGSPHNQSIGIYSAGTYTIAVIASEKTGLFIINSDGSHTDFPSLEINGVQTFTLTKTEELGVYNNADTKIMLTRGSHPYPYEPYNGGIIHEKDLSGIQLFPEGVNPAQTIGGDWEDKGTVTTSDNTVFHAYKRLS